ncbi:MAG: 30S ribosomal protein S24e [Methanomicrobiales archaeon]|nr:30S ribosomal protein S24e [Methanomicrobiales archaeon]
MDIRIDSDKRNELLGRREIEFTLNYKGATPSRKEVLDKISAKLNLDQKLVVLNSFRTRFGSSELHGLLRVYDREEMKSKLERPYLFERGKKEEKKEEGAKQ